MGEDYKTPVQGTGRGDEFGLIARTLEKFSRKLDEGAKAAFENKFRGTAFEGSSACLMMADADMVITSINPALVKVFDQHLSEFQKIAKDFSSSDIVGSNMDFYHPPEMRDHVRKLVQDPANLPITPRLPLAKAVSLWISTWYVMNAVRPWGMSSNGPTRPRPI